MRFGFLVIAVIILHSCSLSAESQQFNVIFYSETISFDFDKDKLPSDYYRFDEWFVRRYYRELSTGNFDELISILKENQQKYNLNGWLTYDLITEMIDEIASEKPTNYKRLLTWFLLTKMDYDARLTHYKNTYYIQVYTTDNLYQIPFFELNDRTFINVTAVKNSKKNRRKNLDFFLIEYIPNPKGKPLTFSLIETPTFTPEIVTRTIRYWGDGKWRKIMINLDKNIIDLMDDYPIVEERDYLERNFSGTLKNSLVNQLRQQMANLSELDKVQFLLAFTRSGFKYKEDTEHFGYNRPMIADEVLYYTFSDCEDRSALFYNLVKELIDLPMIIVAYSDHLTIGVKLKNNQGKLLHHNGETYTICDPTGPNNSDKVGIYPKGYERKSYEIIGSYE
jgi:hypothetical protein